jgi:hypothetical protein
MTGIETGNFLYGENLTIVTPVSSTPQGMDLSPLPVSGFFLPNFFPPKKKPAIDTDAGFPVFPDPSSRHGFCARIMILKCRLVYMQCSMKKTKESPPG